MKKSILFFFVALFSLSLLAQGGSSVTTNLWINELHYDNAGVDTLEGFEVAGPAGTDLACYKAYLYNGNGGVVYDSLPLSGILPNEGCGFGAIWFPLPSGGLQNGAPDGLAIAFMPSVTGCGSPGSDQLIDFITYEGALTATSGIASGIAAVNIIASEAANSPVGTSIQVLNGPENGLATNLRVWCSGKIRTPGVLNAGQNFCATPPAPVFRFVSTAITVNEAAGTVVAGLIQLSNPRVFSNTVEVQLDVPGSDLTVTTSPVTVTLCGFDTVPFSINVVDDALFEGTEQVQLKLRNPSGVNTLGADSTFTVTILDNDTLAIVPTINFGQVSLSQLESVTSVNVPVTLQNANANATSVTVSILGGTANTPADYTLSSATITFPANTNSTQNAVLTIVNDALFEANETVLLGLTSLTNGAVKGVDSLFTYTILNDDPAPANPIVKLSATSATFSEGVGTFTVQADILGANANATSVTLSVTGGTATAGTDFSPTSALITFPANSSASQNVTITVTDDQLVEGNETIIFTLSSPTNNATLDADSQITVTLTDNDVLEASISPASANAGEADGQVLVSVALSIPYATDLSVDVVSIGGSATNGADYIFTDTTLTWTAGSNTTFVLPVTIINDTICGEGAETITLQLENASNPLVLGNATYSLTLADNDTCPVVTPYGECLNLYFSEYVEGSSNNKALEIYNPTAAAIDLSGYFLAKKSNGTTLSSYTLSGSVAPGDVYVIANPSANALILAQADATNNFINFNGDDAVYLLQGTDTIDVIGDFNNYPGAGGWGVGSGGTANSTLIRNAYRYFGHKTWPDAVSSWFAYASDMTDSLGFHTQMPCGTPPPVGASSANFDTTSLSVAENFGVLNIPISVSNQDLSALTFDVVVSGGTASIGADFTLTTTNFNVPGNTIVSVTVPVSIINDIIGEGNETFQLTITNLSGAASSTDSVITVTIVDNDPVGIAEQSDAMIQLYPNPAKNNVTIRCSSEMENLEVFTLQGVRIFSTAVTSDKLTLNLQDWADGVYLLKVNTRNESRITRFLIGE